MKSPNLESGSNVLALNKCSACSLRNICIPDSMTGAGLHELESFLEASTLYSNNEKIFSADQRLDKIFAVKSGMVKTVMLNPNGKEHIVGFHLSGEVFGLDAIYPKKYLSTALAIGTVSICSIDYNTLEHLASHLPLLQHQLFGLLSQAVQGPHKVLGDLSSEQKLARFLLELSSRYKQRGFSESRMNLAMPRRDIASHLNMAPETVSRLFNRFQEQGLVTIQRTDLNILDFEVLRSLSEGSHSTRHSELRDSENVMVYKTQGH